MKIIVNNFFLNRDAFHDMIGKDPAVGKIFEMLAVVAPSDGTMLVAGNIQVKLPSNGLQQAAIQFEQHSFPIGNGPLQILSVKNHLIINLMLDHTILIVPLRRGVPDFSQAARIVNAGPFWSVAALIADEKLVIAAGGIENRPLSRTTGEFGYLDSFLYLFTLEKDQQGRFRWHAVNRKDARRYRAFNLSERKVLTPKAMAFIDTGNAIQKLLVTGYGAERAIEFTISSDGVVSELEFSVMPGISDVVVSTNRKGPSLVYTSPLLDRIVKHDLSTGAVLNELATKAFHSPERSIKVFSRPRKIDIAGCQHWTIGLKS